jgi:hypothetical protein
VESTEFDLDIEDDDEIWDMRQKMSARIAMLWRAQGSTFLEHHHQEVEADVDRLRLAVRDTPPYSRPVEVMTRLAARAFPPPPAVSSRPTRPAPARTEAVIDLSDDDAIVVIPDGAADDPILSRAAAQFAAAGGTVTAQATACRKHPFAHSADNCRKCRDSYCADCLVYVGPAQRTYCVDCALVAAGIRPKHAAHH